MRGNDAIAGYGLPSCLPSFLVCHSLVEFQATSHHCSVPVLHLKTILLKVSKSSKSETSNTPLVQSFASITRTVIPKLSAYVASKPEHTISSIPCLPPNDLPGAYSRLLLKSDTSPGLCRLELPQATLLRGTAPQSVTRFCTFPRIHFGTSHRSARQRRFHASRRSRWTVNVGPKTTRK